MSVSAGTQRLLLDFFPSDSEQKRRRFRNLRTCDWHWRACKTAKICPKCCACKMQNAHGQLQNAAVTKRTWTHFETQKSRFHKARLHVSGKLAGTAIPQTVATVDGCDSKCRGHLYSQGQMHCGKSFGLRLTVIYSHPARLLATLA